MKKIITDSHVRIEFNNDEERDAFIADYGDKAGVGHDFAWSDQFGDDEGEVVDYPASAFGKVNDWTVVTFTSDDEDTAEIDKVYAYVGKSGSPFEELIEKGKVFLMKVNWK